MEDRIVLPEKNICASNDLAMKSTRLDWLDALRALAMLFVIYGHLYKQYEFFVITSPIKIPLFFAVSGYLLYGKNENRKVFFQRMLHRIIFPWLILSLGFGTRYILTQGIQFYINYVIEVLLGKRVWYIICCIIAQIIFYFLQKLCDTGWKLAIAVLLAVVLGLVLSEHKVGDVFQFRTALICQLYLLIGYWIKKYESRLLRIKFWKCLGMFAIYVMLAAGSMFLYPGKIMDVHNDFYYSKLYCFVLVVVGCVSVFICAQKIKRYPKLLCAIGRNTLVFYIHDVFWRGMASRGMLLLGINVPKTWYGALIWLAISCAGCGFEAYILNKVFPIATGQKRKKSVAA